MSPNELIIAMSDGMTPEEMNAPFSISMGAQADNITVKTSMKTTTYVEGWYKHERLAVCGIVMTSDGKVERE